MVRTSLLSLAMVVFTGAIASSAAPNPPDKTGFRVYSISPKCQSRTLLGVYISSGEAFRVAAEHRGKSPGWRIEVSTGAEGKLMPTGRPVLYEVYTRFCSRSNWESQARFVDAKQAEEAVKAFKAKYTQVQIVHDFTTREVFQVYGANCSRSWRILGTYVTAQEACKAGTDFRTNHKFCLVTAGARGQSYWALGQPAQYQVYVQRCRGGWLLETTTKDQKEAEKAAEACKANRTEIVRLYASK